MATIYRCDVCKFETRLTRDLYGVKFSKRDGSTSAHSFDICEKCQEKMFKPVKEIRFKMKIAFEYDDKT